MCVVYLDLQMPYLVRQNPAEEDDVTVKPPLFIGFTETSEVTISTSIYVCKMSQLSD